MTVVDASVVIKWFVEEPDFEAAKEVLQNEIALSAPSHVLAEAGRGLLRRKRSGDLAAEDAKRALAGLPLMISLAPLEQIASMAFDIADRASVTIYDALYVALAEQSDSVLVTADRRLCEGLRSTPWASRAQHLQERARLRSSAQRS